MDARAVFTTNAGSRSTSENSKLSSCSNNTLAAADVQHIVARIMGYQKQHGKVFLRSSGVRESARGALMSPGKHFSIAGHVRVVQQMMSDGPATMLEFTVPQEMAVQHDAFNDITQKTVKLSEPCPFNAAVFTIMLDPAAADQHLYESPSPMFPVLNCALDVPSGHVH